MLLLQFLLYPSLTDSSYFIFTCVHFRRSHQRNRKLLLKEGKAKTHRLPVLPLPNLVEKHPTGSQHPLYPEFLRRSRNPSLMRLVRMELVIVSLHLLRPCVEVEALLLRTLIVLLLFKYLLLKVNSLM